PCLLNQKGKLPNGELKDFLASNPFLLRAEALERNLTKHEFGRVLMHLAKRRGYKSNQGIKYNALFRYIEENNIDIRYTDQEDVEQAEVSGNTNQHGNKKEAEETGKVLGGIRKLKSKMETNETIGQFAVRIAQNEHWETPHRLHTISMDETKTLTKGKSKGQEKTTTYHLHATRELYEDEFSRIWNRQADNLCRLLNQTPEQVKTLIEKIEHAIFDQSPPQLQKGKVGMCSIRLKKKRAATALLESQAYLLLQDINNLEYGKVSGKGKRVQSATMQPLSAEQRQQLLNALSDHGQVDKEDRLTWDTIRKILRLDDDIKFNLEISSNKDKSGEQIKSSKKGIIGNRTALAIARIIPEEWKGISDAQKHPCKFTYPQKALVNDLLNIHDKVALFNRLRNHYRLPPQRCPWQFSDQQAFELATLELPAGYMGHCFEVITELLKHFRDGLNYSEAKKEAKLTNQLESSQPKHLGEPPNIANPIVQKALYEIRRVVNAIIEKQGCKPRIIRIEMARDMKASKAHRAEMENRNEANRKLNEKATEAIRDWNQHNPHQTIGLEHANIEKIKLWIEQRAKPDKESTTKIKLWQEQNHQCLYSGRYISFPQIADGEVDIDHIYPRSLSGMNDYLNKALAFKSENLSKGQRTPWQAWGDSEKYDLIVRRTQDWYGGNDTPLKAKLNKVMDKSDEAAFKDKMREFTEAQLNDTRYICVAVKNYLKKLGYTDQEIQVSRGRATAEIRHLWSLDTILPKTKRDQESKDTDKEPDNNEVDETESDKTEKGKKKGRGDHRHHAIDAIITALTDRRTFANLQRRYCHYELNGTWPNAPLEKPWETLRRDVERIVMNRVVSFSATRKVSGGLHDEQPYGLGHYEEKMPFKKLLKSLDIIRTLPDKTPGKKLEDGDTWIADHLLRQKLQEWLVNWECAKYVKGYPPPLLPDGKSLDTVTVARRCYVKRASVVEGLKRIENSPGKKTWIANDELRKILRIWLKQPGNSVKSAKVNPPTMPSKNGNGNPIRTVRLASVFTSMVQFKGKPQIFAKASNHHVVIFKRVLNGTIVERKGILVDRLEAAKRIRKPPVVRKSPQELLSLVPAINPSEWQFEMFLCNNDMVLWDVDDPDWQQRDKIYLDEKNQHLPIYRLQKMTEGTLTFRHFSVTSTADTGNRGVLRRSPTKLCCKKIRIDELGDYNICND
ncbi:MAG TPA: type II CRISPR RNA-guided endonuclease Cas9, partial [Candidatus Brocadiaceae bacterium]